MGNGPDDTGKVDFTVRAYRGKKRPAMPPISSEIYTPCLFISQGDLVRTQLSPAGYRELGRARLIDPTPPLFEHTFA